jgi:hypothetical protein
MYVSLLLFRGWPSARPAGPDDPGLLQGGDGMLRILVAFEGDD